MILAEFLGDSYYFKLRALFQIRIKCHHTLLQGLHVDIAEVRLVVFLILDCEAIGTAATPGLFCQPRVIVEVIMEKQME
jgi:hypothetical protein